MPHAALALALLLGRDRLDGVSVDLALIIAGVSAAATAAAVVVAVLALKRSKDAQVSADRSAQAAERSAEAGEETARVARAELEMRRRQTGAELILEVVNVTAFEGGSRLKFEISNHGGSTARQVQPGELLANGAIRFTSNGLDIIPPGGVRSFRADGPSGGVAGQLGLVEAEAVTYVDDLGYQSVLLTWRRP